MAAMEERGLLRAEVDTDLDEVKAESYHDGHSSRFSIDEDDVDFTTEARRAPRSSPWYWAKTALTWTRWATVAALPRFITGLPSTDNLHATAYLDGLRGWAAYCVFNSHQNSSLRHDSIPYYPIPRLLTSGSRQVPLFFVISGYALSCKFIRQPDGEFLSKHLASSIFRRWLRLFSPYFIVTFIAMIFIHLHLHPEYDEGVSIIAHPVPQFHIQVLHWLKDFMHNSNPFGYVSSYIDGVRNVNGRYGYQLWTIPAEFKGSIVLFLYITVVYRLPQARRLGLIFATVPFVYYWDAAFINLFLYGYVLAMTAPTEPVQLPVSAPSTPKQTLHLPESIFSRLPARIRRRMPTRVSWSTLRTFGLLVLFFVSLTLFFSRLDRWAHYAWHSFPPFTWLAPILRHHRGNREDQLIPGVGAVGIIFCMQRVRWLRWPFETRIVQYLGKVSFGLYLTHVNTLQVLQSMVLQPYRESLPEGDWRRGYVGQTILYCVVLFVALVVADWFERMDTKVQTWVKKLEKWVYQK